MGVGTFRCGIHCATVAPYLFDGKGGCTIALQQWPLSRHGGIQEFPKEVPIAAQR